MFGISAAPHFASLPRALTSAIGIFRFVPRTTTALRFLEPMTAPMPVRPLARLPMLMIAARRTPFSPAGPIAATSTFGSSSSSLSRSVVSDVVLPHRWPAGRSSASPSWIHR